MFEPKMSEALQVRVKAFGATLTTAQKEEFIEVLSNVIAEMAVEANREARTLFNEAKTVMGRNLLTLLR